MAKQTCAAVLLLLLFWCLIAFTPLRRTIPGYPDAASKREAALTAMKIDSLENSITRWELYMKNLSRVLTGQEAFCPDSLSGGAARYLSDKSAEQLLRQDSLLRATVAKEELFEVGGKEDRRLPIEGMQFFPPLKGVISTPYDPALHPAVDITAPANTVVKAVLDGTIVYAGWTDADGYTIVMQHSSDISSIYMQNEKLLKGVGSKVKAGTPIALVGSSADLTTGDHLHFQLWYRGQTVDPTKYIGF